MELIVEKNDASVETVIYSCGYQIVLMLIVWGFIIYL